LSEKKTTHHILHKQNSASPKTRIHRLKGTYFYGGAGLQGAYIQDMVTALKEVGIKNTKAGRSNNSVGQNIGIPGIALDDMVIDALAVLSLNKAEAYVTLDISEFPLSGPQFNLVGYSYGSIIAAIKALSYADLYNGSVDHVVLVGAPIEQGLLNRLQTNPGIGRVIVKNLKEQGDPIHAGMTDGDIALASPVLGYQMVTGSGHFWYSPMNEQGKLRRRHLAKWLVQLGLR